MGLFIGAIDAGYKRKAERYKSDKAHIERLQGMCNTLPFSFY